jgi:hypothetical protein
MALDHLIQYFLYLKLQFFLNTVRNIPQTTICFNLLFGQWIDIIDVSMAAVFCHSYFYVGNTYLLLVGDLEKLISKVQSYDDWVLQFKRF